MPFMKGKRIITHISNVDFYDSSVHLYYLLYSLSIACVVSHEVGVDEMSLQYEYKLPYSV